MEVETGENLLTKNGLKNIPLKGHYDEVNFSWCHFLNKWFKIIFIYPYGKIPLPFWNKKHI